MQLGLGLEYEISLEDYNLQSCIRLGYTFDGFMSATGFLLYLAQLCLSSADRHQKDLFYYYYL